MIVLYSNIQNTVVLTLNEKALSLTHDWLIEFCNDVTGELKYFTPVDTSSDTTRYNRFLLLGEGITGFSSYTVYEMPVSSPRSEDKTQAYGIVETGKVIIIDPSDNQIVNFNVGDTKNNSVFE